MWKKFLNALFQIRNQSGRIVKWISLHPKQTKLDMELRVWGALRQKSGIHCLQASNLLKTWNLLKSWSRFGMALHLSATSVQNDFRLYLYVLVCFCLNGTIIQIENHWLINNTFLVWGGRRVGVGGSHFPTSLPSQLFIVCRCPIMGLLFS